MNDTMLIEITNQKAIGLLHELEHLNLIKVLAENFSTVKPRLSQKYRGIMSKLEGKSLDEHIQKMRNEWNNI